MEYLVPNGTNNEIELQSQGHQSNSPDSNVGGFAYK